LYALKRIYKTVNLSPKLNKDFILHATSRVVDS